MKDMKDIFMEKRNYYKKGDGVKFLIPEVQKDNPDAVVNFDYGKILDVIGDSYKVRLDNGAEIMVHSNYVYAFGNADATPE